MTESLIQPAQSQMIDLPAGRFQYLSWGAEHRERPSVLLLHGITSSASSWVRVGPVLADRYRVYALDMRGHGNSIKVRKNPKSGSRSLMMETSFALFSLLYLISFLFATQPEIVGGSKLLA